ncbi:hypothetical protein [Kitasatospora sp. NPDC093679]|uniref:hypothetical protein n=1 Tax=Kitasatospora sp. NPDC093679 TaxID=3154983 RepID=UPI00344421E8
MPSGVAAAGDGPEGDADLQAAFTRAHSSDLPPDQAGELTALARQVWLAETTGAGRDRWPAYFPTGAGGAGPVHYYSGVRIQAVAAHTAGGPGRAVVGLLWVGTSPSGEYGDHRPATLTFTRTDTDTGWEPIR